MNLGTLAKLCPTPPSCLPDWSVIESSLPWVDSMGACPQDPEHHAEGDVWTHTRMVCEALCAMASWRALEPRRREAVFLAALLHDVAKPARTRVDEQGRIHAPGHAVAGESVARRWLWEHDASPAGRELVARLVRDHGAPLNALRRPDPRRLALAVSWRAGCELTALLAEADVRGRACADAPTLLEHVELFRLLANELGCLDQPFPFANERSRADYFAIEGRDPCHAAFDDSWGEVVVLSGLPGSGKTTLASREMASLPVLSLDDIREERDLVDADEQDEVARIAHERAKTLLRGRHPFLWDATNLVRSRRSALVGLVRAYGGRVRIHCVEASRAALLHRLAARERYVPPSAVERMLDRWQTPDATEAERVTGLDT